MVCRLEVKPDSFLAFENNNHRFLLVQSEHKASIATDVDKAKLTALTQYFLLRGLRP